ncbi:MAG: uncharacterized protein A8A55_1057 [Amphiamblys sp. WSBS2006]|nr:MAG: uncharacterized protein A8A55_1057 [Amphiamblys sp. WSBS2006]
MGSLLVWGDRGADVLERAIELAVECAKDGEDVLFVTRKRRFGKQLERYDKKHLARIKAVFAERAEFVRLMANILAVETRRGFCFIVENITDFFDDSHESLLLCSAVSSGLERLVEQRSARCFVGATAGLEGSSGPIAWRDMIRFYFPYESLR